MEKRPFFDIFSEGDVDLKELYGITEMSFKEDIEKDNELSFSIQSANDEILEEEAFNKGTVIKFRYGLLGIDESETRYAEIADVDCTIFNDLRVSMTVRAYDKGQFLKKAVSKKVHENTKASDIASAIANNHRMKSDITATSFTYKSIPQGNRTDFEFLKYLATKEPDYQFYVQDQTLIFKPEDLKSDAELSIEAGNPNTRFISFKPKSRTTQNSGAESSAQIQTIDPVTGETIAQSLTADDAEDTNLNDYPANLQADSNAKDTTARAGKSITSAEKDPERLEIEAKNTIKQARRKALQGTLNLEGFTKVRAGKILTLSGLKKYAGNYYVRAVTHRVSTQGFLTTAELQTNAVKKPTAQTGTSQVSGSKNKSTGAENPDTRREISPKKESTTQENTSNNQSVSFDANANQN